MLKWIKNYFEDTNTVKIGFWGGGRIKDQYKFIRDVFFTKSDTDYTFLELRQQSEIFNSDYENLPRRCRVRVKHWKTGDMV